MTTDRATSLTFIKRLTGRYDLLCLIMFGLVALVYFARLPIFRLDTDLWYHLNSGRYILTNGSLPHESFFSFVSPPRQYADYYWLFQAIVFKIYTLAGYYGLVALRGLLYLGLTTVITTFLIGKESDAEASRLYRTALIILYSFFFISRAMNLRPHMMSYIIIVLFLLVIERGEKAVVVLPLLSLLWMNVHGIEYPVMILIVGAYVIEYFLRRIGKAAPADQTSFRIIGPLALCLATVFITPNGTELVHVPFITTKFAFQYINELHALTWQDLLNITLLPNILDSSAVFPLFLLVSLASFIAGLIQRRLRISHLILFIGGAYLLIQSKRFRCEYALLVLPMILSALSSPRGETQLHRPFAAALVLAILALTLTSFYSGRQILRKAYPFSPTALPVGVSRFLQSVNANGNVLSDANYGGYYQWMCSPRYKIYMDMEIPFLFHDDDFFIVSQIMQGNKTVFEKFIARYRPSFLAIPRDAGPAILKLIVEHPDFVQVFHDDVAVLFVNSGEHPEIASTYKLHHADMASVDRLRRVPPTPAEAEAMIAELTRLAEVFPDGARINEALAILYLLKNDPDKAAVCGERILHSAPELALGYNILGRCTLVQKKYREAAAYFRLALERAGNSERAAIDRNLATCYGNMGQWSDAYYAFAKTVDLFGAATPITDMEMLGSLALKADETDTAYLCFKYAYLKTPDEQREAKDRLRRKMASFDVFETDDLRDFLTN